MDNIRNHIVSFIEILGKNNHQILVLISHEGHINIQKHTLESQ
ncbi:unnamed protein product [Moneuplotes crassus]|uniref:Uncharacterized protein n=1 Tax=Euplotes crassus TaxID=5936 RepID=A0AAD2D902_EUPCR|nr:unnamed protein product [Moneuplotes crassus]